jgi:hypothetical protein
MIIALSFLVDKADAWAKKELIVCIFFDETGGQRTQIVRFIFDKRTEDKSENKWAKNEKETRKMIQILVVLVGLFVIAAEKQRFLLLQNVLTNNQI